MTFARLRAADWVALVASLALLFVMAADWYSTVRGEEARRIERISEPEGALGGEVEREVREDARLAAEGAEENAWQADGGVDRLILALLLAAVAFGIAAAFLRAAGRRFEPPLTPHGLAGLAAALGALLVGYRLAVDQPGADAGTTVQSAAPVAVVVLGILAYACATAMRAEDAGTAFREPPEVVE